ncbi:MAG TPA: Ig domain-containing protein [Candidatus Nanoarchaeia archaeon]|nr:Ig domain-containing protein [Candidatus Nanoarchaeia archaeon]
MKKAQVSLFILAGIIVFLLSSAVFFYINDRQAKAEVLSSNARVVEPIREYVQACLLDSLDEVITQIALSGGYFTNPKRSLERNFSSMDLPFDAPLYYDGSQVNVISRELMEQQISGGLMGYREVCTPRTMSPLPFEVGEISIETRISPLFVDSFVKLPIIVPVGEEVETIEGFAIRQGSNLFTLHAISKNLSETQAQNGNSLCLTCLLEVAQQNHALLRLFEGEENGKYALLYTLSEDNSSENPSELLYVFTHMFNISSASIGKIAMEEIDVQMATFGYPFRFTAHAIGEGITFSDDTYLFDIDASSGLIAFTPSQQDSGRHLITITAKDLNGQVEKRTFTVDIADFGRKPEIGYIGILTAYAEVPYNYPVSATSSEGLRIVFTDNSSLFDINPESGQISFTPEESDIGEHHFHITAIDANGNYGTEEGIILVG